MSINKAGSNCSSHPDIKGQKPFFSFIIMYQSFATTPPSGPKNNREIDFSLSKARVNALHYRDTPLIKALQKAPLKSQQVNANFHGQFGHGIKTPAMRGSRKFSVRGGPHSDQGWSNKFYHCKNPYFGKSWGGDRTGTPYPPSGSAHACCSTALR